jgi:hypothetical protein
MTSCTNRVTVNSILSANISNTLRPCRDWSWPHRLYLSCVQICITRLQNQHHPFLLDKPEERLIFTKYNIITLQRHYGKCIYFLILLFNNIYEQFDVVSLPPLSRVGTICTTYFINQQLCILYSWVWYNSRCKLIISLSSINQLIFVLAKCVLPEVRAELILFTWTFSNSSYAFRMQEWFNLARDDVLRLRRTPPLVSFLVGCFGFKGISDWVSAYEWHGDIWTTNTKKNTNLTSFVYLTKLSVSRIVSVRS